MEKDDLFENIQEIFRDIFDDEFLTIESSTNSDDIEDWDSLNHINLVVAIENEFSIKFGFDELSDLKDVGAMVNLIMIKKNN
jgi:acyl carrier protein